MKLKWLLLLILAGMVLIGCAKTDDVTVATVYDGDSFVMSNGDEIRLVGIDAPEKDQPGADESRAFLKKLIEGKQIRLEPDKEDKDKYHRLLRYAYVDGVFVNAEMLRNGHAKTLFIPPNGQLHKDELLMAESQARQSPKNLGAKQGTTKEETVYVTKSGEKYHRAGCEWLTQTTMPMKLKEARTKYSPCKVCRPPN